MLAEKYLPAARNRHIMEAVKKEGDSLMKITNSKTDICANRFGGNGDVIIEHYLDESMLNDSVGPDCGSRCFYGWPSGDRCCRCLH